MNIAERYPAQAAPKVGVAKITTTRQCWMQCRFCDFSQFAPLVFGADIDPCLSLSKAETQLKRLNPAVKLLKIRGGLSFREPFSYFRALVKTASKMFSGPIQAFSPIELYQWHRIEQRPIRDLLAELRWAGATQLGPGGGESLVQPWRDRLSPNRLDAEAWLSLASLGWETGMPPSAMILAGRWLAKEDLAQHLHLLTTQSWHHLEVKIMRPVTLHPELEPIHLIALCRLVSEIKEKMPDTPLYVNDPSYPLTDDAYLLLTRAGADGFYTTLEDIEP